MRHLTLFDPQNLHLQPGGGLPNHRDAINDIPEVLDVVAVISNPVRYESRYNLYRSFERYVAASGARLTTVELAYGNRPFEVTGEGDPRAVQLRTGHELWHKENLINIGISRLPRDWKYVAWVDADILFARPDWVQETLHQLQHYAVIQMFSPSVNLSPKYEPIGSFRKSWMAAALDGDDLSGQQYGFPHPGFAWAARREAINMLGGLLDTAILGSADLHMARAFVGNVEIGLPKGISYGYVEALQIWQERAMQHVRGNVGVMDGLCLHMWHGRRADRRYNDRWKILVDNQYDPEFDLQRDWQSVWQLTDRNPRLRDQIRGYFRARNEDSVDL
jgi:hypothetical protein